MDSIVLTDAITLGPGHRGHFIDLLRTQYVPGARARGLDLLDIVVRPLVDSPNANTNVVVTWQLPDIETFWEARRAAMRDPSVEGFWKMTANLIVGRSRRFAQPSPPSDPGDTAPAERLKTVGVHHIVLLDLVDGIDEVTVPARVPVRRSSCGRHLPGSVGGVDASWEFDADEPLPFDAIETEGANVIDIAVLGAIVGTGARAPGLRDGIKRTLLLRVDESAPSAAIAEFERDLLAMPRHIAAILNWRLGRVASSLSGWTHAWEQEYADVSGLRDDYMRSPFHWGVVDGWFDAEDPRCIVAPELLHVFYRAASSVLTADG